MANKTQYICDQCNFHSPKWLGQCPSCNTWNSFVETVVEKPTKTSSLSRQATAKPMLRLKDIPSVEADRLKSHLSEFNRALGGGIVPGSVNLIGGEPGIGKSTLLMQVFAAIRAYPKLYITGEESLTQLKLRAGRLDIHDPDLLFVSATDIDSALQTMDELQPQLVIIDSIQSMQTQDLTSPAGSVAQVRECTQRLITNAKQNNVAVFLVGHVTKDGEIAGPKVLEHMVDAVFYLEGDSLHQFRILRSSKNRYGNLSEIGLFEMTEKGLQEHSALESLFVSNGLEKSPGAVRTITMEGSRPLLIELQALTVPSGFGYPKRTASGFNLNRLQLLIAVLIRRAGLKLYEQDVYANIVGGLKLDETALDLPMCLAVTGSLLDQAFPTDMVAIGEVSLSGMIRPIGQLEARISEAIKLGFKKALVPDAGYDKIKRYEQQIGLVPVRSLSNIKVWLQDLNS